MGSVTHVGRRPVARRWRTRLLGAVLSVTLALQLMLSLVWLGRELHHECTGEACPVCQEMAQVARAVTQAAVGATRAPTVALALLAITGPSLYEAPKLSVHTLVSLGVRLDT